jgi:hypothetical protein
MKKTFAIFVFVTHVAIALYLFTLPSTPVRQDIPGLVECKVNEYGGYELACMDARGRQIAAYTRSHPPRPDYLARDAVAAILALIVGVLLQRLVGSSGIAVAIASIAYTVAILSGIVSPWSALALVLGFVTARFANTYEASRISL